MINDELSENINNPKRNIMNNALNAYKIKKLPRHWSLPER
jgi:hypothetical protein